MDGQTDRQKGSSRLPYHRSTQLKNPRTTTMRTTDDRATTNSNPSFKTNNNSSDDSDNSAGVLSLLPLPWTAFVIVALSMAILTAVGGNLLVLISYKRDRGLRTVHTLYLLHLSVCDLMIGGISMPLYLVYTVLYWTWPLGKVMCKVFLAVDFMACCNSTLVVILVAADKLALVTLGANYTIVETRRRAYFKLILCWTCAFLLYSPAILFWDLVRGYSIVRPYGCQPEYNDNLIYVVITEVISFTVPFLSLTIINTRVFLELKKRRKTSHKPEPTRGESTVQCTRSSALTFGRKCGNVGHVADSPSLLLLRNMQPKPKQDSGNSLEESSSPKLIGTTIADDSLATQFSSAHQLANQPSQMPSHCQTTVTSGQFQKSPSSQSTVFSIHSDKDGRSVVSASQLQVGAFSKHARTPKQARPALFLSCVCPSKTDSAPDLTSRPEQADPQKPAQRVHQKRERKAAVILAGLVVALVVFWLPYSFSTILKAFCRSCVNKVVYEVLNWLLWLKSCVNPFLYAYCSPRFRHNFQELFNYVVPMRLKQLRRGFKSTRIDQDHVATSSDSK